MKKFCSLLMVVVLCTIVLLPITKSVASDENKNSVTIIEYIRLSKYLAGFYAQVNNADYNSDNKIDVNDLVALRKMILGLPVDSGKPNEIPKLDNEGYYSEVIKP